MPSVTAAYAISGYVPLRLVLAQLLVTSVYLSRWQQQLSGWSVPTAVLPIAIGNPSLSEPFSVGRLNHVPTANLLSYLVTTCLFLRLVTHVFISTGTRHRDSSIMTSVSHAVQLPVVNECAIRLPCPTVRPSFLKRARRE